tara:strand:+ start:155 stop:493 length:339 start_codon:yes stop_codon:yes gene_type:complete
MTETKLERPKKLNFWTSSEKENSKEKYGCEIIIENGSFDDVNTTNAPSDSYITCYIQDDKEHYDLVRGTKVSVFDMYYDKFKNNIKSIKYGRGNIKPALWGYRSPQQKKKRK